MMGCHIFLWLATETNTISMKNKKTHLAHAKLPVPPVIINVLSLNRLIVLYLLIMSACFLPLYYSCLQSPPLILPLRKVRKKMRNIKQTVKSRCPFIYIVIITAALLV